MDDQQPAAVLRLHRHETRAGLYQVEGLASGCGSPPLGPGYSGWSTTPDLSAEEAAISGYLALGSGFHVTA